LLSIVEFFLKYLNKNLQTPMGKGVYLIARSTVIGQGIAILSSPILTRLFSPSDFGIFALYFSIITILLVFASLKYEYAIPLPQKDEDAFYLVVTCFILILAVLVCIGTALFLFGGIILDSLNYTSLEPYLWLILFSFLCAGAYQILNFWAVREKDYKLIGNTLVGKSISGSLSKILLGWLSTGVLGLITGDLIGQITGNYSIFRKFWQKNASKFNNFSVKEVVRLLREYYRFPAFSLPSAFFNVLAFQLPVFMLIAVYGSSEAGLYSLAYSVIALPVSFLSSSISQVYLGEISNLIRDAPNKLRSLYHSVIRQVALVVIPLITLIAVVAPLFFPILFGESWAKAGIYCTILSGMLVLQVIFSPVSILHYCGFNSWVFAFDISRTMVIFCIFISSSILQLSALISIMLYSIAMALMYGLNYYMNIRAIICLEKYGSIYH